MPLVTSVCCTRAFSKCVIAYVSNQNNHCSQKVAIMLLHAPKHNFGSVACIQLRNLFIIAQEVNFYIPVPAGT